MMEKTGAIIYLVCGYNYESCDHFYATVDRDLAFELREKWGSLLDDLRRWEDEYDKAHPDDMEAQHKFYEQLIKFTKRCYPDIPVSPGVLMFYRGVCVEEVPLVWRQ